MSYQFTNYKAPYRTHVLPQNTVASQIVHRVASVLLSLLSLVMVVLVVFSYSSTSGRLKNLYFLRVDLSLLDATSLAEAPPSYEGLLTDITGNFTAKLGFSYFYQFGVSGYCKGQEPDQDSFNDYVITECFSPSKPYWVDVAETVNNDFVHSFTVDGTTYVGDSLEFPENVVSYNNTAKHTMTAAWIMYVISIAFLVLEIIFSCVPTMSLIVLQVGSAVSVVAFLLVFLPAVIYTAVYSIIKNRINNDFDFGAFSTSSSAILVVTWLGVLFAWLSALSWLISSSVIAKKQGVYQSRPNQPTAGEPVLDQPTYNQPTYNQGTSNQEPYNQETYNQETYNQETYNQEPYNGSFGGQTYNQPPSYPMNPIK